MPTWIWVRDDVTGAHYDVEERSLRDGMTPVEGYPVRSGPNARPRRAKPLTDLVGQPTTPAHAAAPTDEVDEAPADADNEPATTPAQPAESNEE